MKLPPTTHKKMIERQHNRCFYCGEELITLNYEIDHIMPFSKYKDGSNFNLCLACTDCNRKKSNLELHEFKELVVTKYPHKLIRNQFYFEFLKLY